VTGLFPESHGIVGNTFWDPALGEEFYYTDPLRSMSPKWWTSTGAEPLWSTCEKQGVRSAIHMWPGSEAGIAPEPQTVDKFNSKEPLSNKVSRVLSFLDRPSEFDPDVKVSASEARPQFIGMYVPNVDADGHKYGPNSTEIRSTIQNVDHMLESLFTGLSTRNLTDIVNIVILSDHGMATTSTSRLIQLDELLDPSTIDHIDGWPLYGLRPKPSVDMAALHTSLTEASKNNHFTVYLRSEIPSKYHFSHSDRIAPLWLVPDPGWAIVEKSQFDVSAGLASGAVYHPRGLHGYDNTHPLMRAIFIARGPAFPHSPNSRVDVFQNTEVYNIIADSLGVDPQPNNGTLRLPLKPIGTHDKSPGKADGEESQDLDPYPVTSLTTSISATSTSPSTQTSSSFNEPLPSESNNHTGQDKDSKPHNGGGLLGSLLDGLKDAKNWFEHLWGKVKGTLKGDNGKKKGTS
jgi:predicted AlkP superfamily pyrophosphatase or phosphodiesterase